jgi:23S rRNA pseudouridine2605 synthase
MKHTSVHDIPAKKQESKVGLARVLSKLGYCSRSAAGELIRAGKVRVNGVVRLDPEFPVRMARSPLTSSTIRRASDMSHISAVHHRANTEVAPGDRIEIGERPLVAAEPIYLVMNKPRGMVTTASDEKGRRTVYDLLPENTPWLGPVGRLDKASEGLLLLTNNSEWAARIGDPETHLDKTYHVQVATDEPESLLDLMVRGRRVGGELLRVKSAGVLRSGAKNAWLEIVLDEGRNRQIRRLLDALGVEVLRLVRVSIGPLVLGELKKGEVRELTAEEKREIDVAIGRN